MWEIFSLQLADYLKSLRLHIGLVLTVFLMVANGFVYTNKYAQETRDYNDVMVAFLSKHLNRYRNAWRLSRSSTVAMKKPLRIQFVSEGGQSETPNTRSTMVTFLKNPHKGVRSNYKLPEFTFIDWEFIVKVVLGFLAIILVYDSISGDRERGTLKLVLSNSVPRRKVFLARFLAAFAILAFCLVIGAVISLIIVIRGIPLRGSDWVRIGFFLVLSFVYFALMVLIGMMVSSLSRGSITSLVMLLLVWVTFVAAVPGVAMLLGRALRPLPSSSKVRAEIEAAKDKRTISREYRARDAAWRDIRAARADNYAKERRALEIDRKHHEMISNIYADFLHRKFSQRRLVQGISYISPAMVFGFCGQSILGTGFLRDQEYERQTREYRNTLARFMAEFDARDPESPHLLFGSVPYMTSKPLDPNQVPRFSEKEVPIYAGFKDGMYGIILLLVEVVAVLMIGIRSFDRYDVT